MCCYYTCTDGGGGAGVYMTLNVQCRRFECSTGAVSSFVSSDEISTSTSAGSAMTLSSSVALGGFSLSSRLCFDDALRR